MAHERIVMGIDLGTTNSCVGVWLNGRVEIVPSDQDKRTTPSCVAFTDRERLVGDGANHQVASNASNTIFDVKRLMGRSFSDASVKSDAKYWPFGVMEGPQDKPLIRVSYLGEEKVFSPEEISAMVLVKMKETAEAYAGRSITDAVVTVPAYFNSSQRQATRDAGVIAGLNVLRILNEPTTAAIAYGLNTKYLRETTVVVYDLGGGTLDVSLVVIDKDGLRLQVKATAGDTHLGGEDFTNNMVDHFVKEFKVKNPHTSGDISGDRKALGRLRRSCEDAKKKLSTNPRIAVEVYALFEGINFHSEITREQFEMINGELFQRCTETIAKCLMYGDGSTKVDDVVLVGGSTRIPRVHQLVKDFFNGKEPCRNINADEAVAYGATVQAMLTFTRQNPRQVLDITPFSHGIGILEGIMWEVIERYTTIPTTKETTFLTVVNKATIVPSSVDITVYEDERAMANKSWIALHPKNMVRFHIDQDGILHVSASAQDEEGRKTLTSSLAGARLSTEEIERMKQDTHKYKALDEEHKKNVQARNDIHNLLFTVGNNMKNLEDAAAGLVPPPHPEPTREQDKGSTPGFLGFFNSNKAEDKKDNLQLQAHQETIKKLPDRIKKLRDIADETAQCLESKDLATSDIIHQKEHIEGEYLCIRSLIEGYYHSISRH